jgi:hypothetical protein
LVEQLVAPVVQQRAADKHDSNDVTTVHTAASQGVATPASSLPFSDVLQRAFGRHDVSSIQAHTGPEAAASTGAMGAKAYATGDHVVLGRTADLHTVAHEAAHVVQQRGGVQLKGGVGTAADVYERHADAAADRVVASQSAEDLLDQGAASDAHGATRAIQRKEGKDDAKIIENPGGKGSVIAREEIKTGAHDTNADARRQLDDQTSLLSDAAAGKTTIRLEVGNRDITEDIDLASDAAARKSTRGPAGKSFDKSLGVSASDLEALCKELLGKATVTGRAP